MDFNQQEERGDGLEKINPGVPFRAVVIADHRDSDGNLSVFMGAIRPILCAMGSCGVREMAAFVRAIPIPAMDGGAPVSFTLDFPNSPMYIGAN